MKAASILRKANFLREVRHLRTLSGLSSEPAPEVTYDI